MRNFIVILSIALFSHANDSLARESTCYGTTKDGQLKHGVKLPNHGINFISYGTYPELSNRTYVHSRVKKIIISAYKDLASSRPESLYKYAETGFAGGGKFAPHRTHQNGLSVDFMVPVKDKNNLAVYFPTTKLNRYGYDVEFDKHGQYKNYQIDFEALAEHIVTLDKVAKKKGLNLWRVIFSPDLQDNLYKTSYGIYLKKHVIIPTKRSWVRHDEHYHVDFAIKCKKL